MAAPVGQNNWRFCSKCYCLWWNGNPSKGVCAAGGRHTAFQSAAGPRTTPADPEGGGGTFDYCLVADPVLFAGPE
jgi:hypothetical protein